MTKMVLVNTIDNAYFTQVMDELRQAQRIFHRQPPVAAIGRKYPKFAPKMVFITNIITYFLGAFAKCICFVIDGGEALD
jgi:hypothetical protein